MLKEQIIKSLKIALGSVVAIVIARALNMEFHSTAGTIVIVSMLSSKKQSIRLASTRLLTAIISLSLSSLLFLLLGFSLPILALYLMFFTFLMYQFQTKTAIVLNVVLVMQIYSVGEVSLSLVLNEFFLMFLGIVVALVFNFYMLDIESELIKYQKQAEDEFNLIFKNIGLCLINECRIDELNAQLDKLNGLLSLAKERAYKYMNSYYIYTNNYYVEYFIMRKQQYYIVKSMQKFLKLKFLKKSEVMLLKSFTDNFLYHTDVLNACECQIEKLEEIKYHFNNTELPTSHKQLKNRIALNQYLYSLEELIALKIRFIERFQ